MVELFSPQLMKRSNMIRCYSCPIQELIMCDWVVWTPASSSFHPLARRRKQIRRSVSPFSQCGSYQRTPGEVTARAWSQRPRRAYWCNSHAFYPDRCVLSLQEEVTAHYSCENRGLFFYARHSCAFLRLNRKPAGSDQLSIRGVSAQIHIPNIKALNVQLSVWRLCSRHCASFRDQCSHTEGNPTQTHKLVHSSSVSLLNSSPAWAALRHAVETVNAPLLSVWVIHSDNTQLMKTLLGLYCDHRQRNFRCRAHCMGEIKNKKDKIYKHVSLFQKPSRVLNFLFFLQILQFAFDCFCRRLSFFIFRSQNIHQEIHQ